MGSIACPNCQASLPAGEIAAGWCESCGKKLPTWLLQGAPGSGRGPDRQSASSESENARPSPIPSFASNPLPEDWEDPELHHPYEKWITILGVVFAVVGLGMGILFAIKGAPMAETGRQVKKVILAPLTFGLVGGTLGVCVGCFLAPSSFLGRPAGRLWMNRIGTKNVVVARIACLLLGAIISAFLAGVGWLLMLV
jgi:hypothetical protein